MACSTEQVLREHALEVSLIIRHIPGVLLFAAVWG